MALWRDPLDDLIADLERAIPPAPPQPAYELPPIEDVQWCVDIILNGTPEEKAALASDPRYVRAFGHASPRSQ
jgi:hypothetical protein